MVIATHRVDPLYLWVREIHDSSFPHYHFLLWINSNAIKNKFTIFNITNETWKNTLKINEDGLVHYCLSKIRYPEYGNGTVIDKNKEDFYREKRCSISFWKLSFQNLQQRWLLINMHGDMDIQDFLGHNKRRKLMFGDEIFLDQLRKELPPVFTREFASEKIGRIFSAKSMSNADALRDWSCCESQDWQ